MANRVHKHELIKDWSKPNGRIIKKGTLLTLDDDLFNELYRLGIVEDRYNPKEYQRLVRRSLSNDEEE